MSGASSDGGRAVSTQESPKRRQIREGATDLFLEKGFTRSSADAIAAAAGVSKATLYAHYEDKDDILADVIHHRVADMFAVELPTRATDVAVGSVDDVRTGLIDLYHTVVSAALRPDHIRLLRVVIAESPHHASVTAAFRDLAPGRALVATRAILEAGRAAGHLPGADVDVLARLLVGDMISWIILDGLLSTSDGAPPSRPRVARSVDAVLEPFR